MDRLVGPTIPPKRSSGYGQWSRRELPPGQPLANEFGCSICCESCAHRRIVFPDREHNCSCMQDGWADNVGSRWTGPSHQNVFRRSAASLKGKTHGNGCQPLAKKLRSTTAKGTFAAMLESLSTYGGNECASVRLFSNEEEGADADINRNRASDLILQMQNPRRIRGLDNDIVVKSAALFP